ncbi:MAG TPA: ABC transporter permease [Solirubrobacteraceae bacterium]|jgi:ABC-2 type transport system permease protein|nr:ABC transporter permease [Solirubrobacteraceae bacterium]
MAELSAAGSAFAAVLRRDLAIYMSYRTRFVSQLASSLFSLALFYYVSRLVHVRGFGEPDRYYAFVVVGLAILGVIYACFATPGLVRQELVAGTLERLVLSPFGAVRSIVAMTLFPLAYASLLATASLALACAVFGLQLHWATVPLALPLLVLTLFAFLPFGLLFAALTIVIKQDNVGTNWVVSVLALVGGMYFPVTLLPHWLQVVGHLQPFTPATELLRHLLVASPLRDSAGISLAKLALFAAVLSPVSVIVLARAVRIGQRRATIIEY